MHRLLALTLLLFAFGAQAEKPGLVLLNIQGPDIADHDRDQYRAVLAKALGQKYTVYSGADVDKKLAKTAKKVCDDVKCLQDVAIAYQATLIGRGVIVKDPGGYSVTVEIRDIFSDRVEVSETTPCRYCDKYQIFEKLTELATGNKPTATARPAKPTAPGKMEVEELTPQVMATGSVNQSVLIVDSDPPKADVWLGDRKVGATPYQNTQFRPGERVIVTLKSPGYKDKAVAVRLKAGFNHLKGVKLVQAMGSLMVSTDPFAPEAEVWVAGSKVGVVPANIELPVGERTLEIRGSAAGRQTVTVTEGETQMVLVAVQAFGTGSRDCPDCPEMVAIPAGNFQMGSNDGDSDEKPVHTVNIKAFRMATYETTVGEFRRFVSATGYRTEVERGDGCYKWTGEWKKDSNANWKSPGFSQTDRHPVTCVSWNDAQAYLKWLSQQSGKTYRLPSEAEFEYANRAGGTTKWPWGGNANEACKHANLADQTAKSQVQGASGWTIHECNDGHGYTAPVGNYTANAFGLHDMSGNVWEWAQDCWNDSYSGAPSDGSAWTSGNCGRRVIRGGSWGGGPRDSRAADRSWSDPDLRTNLQGFRPVQD